MEASYFGHVWVPAGEITAEAGEPADDEGGAGLAGEPDGVHAHGGGLGGFSLGEAGLGPPDLVKNAAAGATFAPVLAGARGGDLRPWCVVGALAAGAPPAAGAACGSWR